MSGPEIQEAELHAYLDGELAEARRAEVEAYVAAHAAEGQRLDAYRAQDEALRARFEPVLSEPLPQRLTRAPARKRRAMRYVATVGWILLGAAGGWQLHGLKAEDTRTDPPGWARRAAVAHVVYAPEVRHPVEVGANDEAHLVAWLSKRLGTGLRIPPLGGLGYTLVGGRLLPGDQGPVAQFMYQDERGQRLTLYVRINAEHSRETAFRFARQGNVGVFYWIDRKLGYALSGEIDKDELLRVAGAVYQHLNP